ncbi:MAG: lysophospholipid acyltransferase family protein [Bacteroides sp.]|nr:lysophospholipid acyltransferase family protein [Bacteroides sp.]MCM1413837.1 lysophospholipid acyltransferase family protein [Bacteroides sp.]MCM1472400.1 lysophospholipid acyltransferase family protein [Bacteroides sp.]
MSTQQPNEEIRPDVLNYEDIVKLVPKLEGHKKLVDSLLHFLSVDKVNDVHSRFCDTPGPEFVARLLDDLQIRLRVDNEQVLDHLPEGAFITVSNHPFGALDGITLIYLITRHRPEFRVMVNMILNKISAMRPNFIAVDAMASDDPEKRKVSIAGIFTALRQLKQGHPVGFFPAGAMSTVNWRGRLQDRQWQPSIIQIISKAKVPVIPIYFHGSNSWWFNILGKVCWPARSLRLPAEVWRKAGKEIHVSIGNPISPEEQAAHASSVEELGQFLRDKTYELRKLYH